MGPARAPDTLAAAPTISASAILLPNPNPVHGPPCSSSASIATRCVPHVQCRVHPTLRLRSSKMVYLGGMMRRWGLGWDQGGELPLVVRPRVE